MQNSRYSSTYDAEQTLRFRIKHASSGISSFRNVANDGSKFGWDSGRQQRWGHNVGARYPFGGCYDYWFTCPGRILAEWHVDRCQAGGQLAHVDRKERQVDII